ncbi:hypothetical protein GCM10010363_65640 [Streptomyces omiyaensis]|nr:hypothetical protein GCM10010363_65640 [Streptomyces omiyaensis]
MILILFNVIPSGQGKPTLRTGGFRESVGKCAGLFPDRINSLFSSGSSAAPDSRCLNPATRRKAGEAVRGVSIGTRPLRDTLRSGEGASARRVDSDATPAASRASNPLVV